MDSEITLEKINPETVSQYINHPSGFLTLSKKNKIFTVGDSPGFIAYRQQGRHLVGLGGLHAPLEYKERLLDAFIEEAKKAKKGVLFVQVREPDLEIFAKKTGAVINQLGSSFTISLKDFTLAGGKKIKLRNKIKRAQKLGLRVVELGKDIPYDEKAKAQLDEISSDWLAGKGKKELDFMIGEIGEAGDTTRRVFLALDKSDRPVAFISYVPVWGERPGYLHDLTRRIQKAPTGAMEFLNHKAIESMIADGIEYLHLGFTPFILNDNEHRLANKIMIRLARLIYKYGQFIYPAESQAEYKLKWGVDILEKEYLVGFPISLRAVLDLLILTRSI